MRGFELCGLYELLDLADEWIKGEENSPYGLDENGNKIPMRDGKQCAEDLRKLLRDAYRRRARFYAG